MKRLLISIILGTLLPLVYMMIVGPLSVYLPDRPAIQYVFYPVRWPVLVAYALSPAGFNIVELSDLSIILFAIVGNIFLYSSIVYFMLFAFSRRRSLSKRPPPLTPTQSLE